MKAIYKLLIPLTFVAGISSCKKVENKIYFEEGKAPLLSANTAAVTLEPGIESNNAITFRWTNPDYKFTTGTSPHDVNYTIEIDTLGANFTSKNKFVTVVAKDLTKAYTVAELNDIMGNTIRIPVGISIPRKTYTFQARVTSSIGSTAVKLQSNILTFTAKPFQPPPTVPVPDASNLWITGSAVASSWSNPFGVGSPYLTSQKFTKLSDTDYELTVAMIPGGGYKLIQTQGDWGSQYSFKSGNALAGVFEKKDATQFDAPSEAGIYKLKFDFQIGTFTAVKQ
jgi:starch-binding outer membrane protein SusE/F